MVNGTPGPNRAGERQGPSVTLFDPSRAARGLPGLRSLGHSSCPKVDSDCQVPVTPLCPQGPQALQGTCKCGQELDAASSGITWGNPALHATAPAKASPRPVWVPPISSRSTLGRSPEPHGREVGGGCRTPIQNSMQNQMQLPWHRITPAVAPQTRTPHQSTHKL